MKYLLTADFICWLLTSTCRRQESYFVHRKRPTTGTGVQIVFTFHISISNDGKASFCCWDPKSDAFYIHTIRGTLYMMINCEIEIDALKGHCYLLLHIATMMYYCKNADFNLLTSDCGLCFAHCWLDSLIFWKNRWLLTSFADCWLLASSSFWQ